MRELILAGSIFCLLGLVLLLGAYYAPEPRKPGLVVEHSAERDRKWPNFGVVAFCFLVCTVGFAMIFYGLGLP